MSSKHQADTPARYISQCQLLLHCFWRRFQKQSSFSWIPWVWHHRRWWWDYSHSNRCDTLDATNFSHTWQPASVSQLRPPSTRKSFSTLPYRSFFIWSLMIFLFSYTIFSDMVCGLLLNGVSLLHSTRNLQIMSLFIHFSINKNYYILFTNFIMSVFIMQNCYLPP